MGKEKTDNADARRGAVNYYKAGKGSTGHIITAVVVTVVIAVAIMIISKLNMGETPSLFGFWPSGLSL